MPGRRIAEITLAEIPEKLLVTAIKVREKAIRVVDDIRPKIIVKKSIDELRREAGVVKGRYFFLT